MKKSENALAPSPYVDGGGNRETAHGRRLDSPDTGDETGPARDACCRDECVRFVSRGVGSVPARVPDALTRTIATSYTSPPTPTAETQTAAGRQRPEKVEVPAYGPTRTGRTVVPLAPYDQ
jgi:hypothetical protein